ncbi:hypothetical protein ACTA71_000679 [Dictyostelium dimigraforme]
MKLNNIIILTILLILIAKSNGQQSSSEIDDNSKCFGNTMETCFTSGSCCIWCGTPKNTSVSNVTGVCYLQNSLGSCPQDVLTFTGDRCKEYNSASCTCSLRNTTNSVNNESSSSPSTFPPINYRLILISIVLVLPCILYNFS